MVHPIILILLRVSTKTKPVFHSLLVAMKWNSISGIEIYL